MTLIDFLDSNIKDTLILVKSLRPDRLILVADEAEEQEKADTPARHMSNAAETIAKQEGFALNVEIVEVNPRDAEGIYEKVREAVGSEEKAYVNLAGENDLMTACAYNLCTKENAAVPVCVDIREGIVRDAGTLGQIAEVKHITLGDYMNAVGAKELENSRTEPEESEYDAVCEMAETLFKNTSAWNHLCTYIGNHYSKDTNHVRIPQDLGGIKEKELLSAANKQLSEFCRLGFLTKKDNDVYEFANDRVKSWMVVFGTWLEMYIFIKIKPYVDEARVGVVIDWSAGDNYDTKDNELDVVVVRNSRPIVISCKMRMPTKEDIYEVGYITNCLSGRSGRSAIATSEIVEHKESWKVGLYPRFVKMNVGLLETIELRKGEEQARKCFEELF